MISGYNVTLVINGSTENPQELEEQKCAPRGNQTPQNAYYDDLNLISYTDFAKEFESVIEEFDLSKFEESKPSDENKNNTETNDSDTLTDVKDDIDNDYVESESETVEGTVDDFDDTDGNNVSDVDEQDTHSVNTDYVLEDIAAENTIRDVESYKNDDVDHGSEQEIVVEAASNVDFIVISSDNIGDESDSVYIVKPDSREPRDSICWYKFLSMHYLQRTAITIPKMHLSMLSNKNVLKLLVREAGEEERRGVTHH
ncbi:hypothetical protein DPMN_094915 [Dreissena polymorpha]|uniref:Uncharacterized protein n=1 Tax=Dreissena polymorpha TaxID=45954 RepID=A0A9D4L6Z2_DREPO|nr:hypothetical protein DPMN_094915 [Dreissena polymorpha]